MKTDKEIEKDSEASKKFLKGAFVDPAPDPDSCLSKIVNSAIEKVKSWIS
jgi:hypothetical protein